MGDSTRDAMEDLLEVLTADLAAFRQSRGQGDLGTRDVAGERGTPFTNHNHYEDLVPQIPAIPAVPRGAEGGRRQVRLN